MSAPSSDGEGWGILRGGEPGARRKKIAGYLKAANELRQDYQRSYLQQFGARGEDDDVSVPGAYPQPTVARSGEEEMIMFPSYARRHTQQQPPPKRRGHSRNPSSSSLNGAEFWKDQWDRHEDDTAIVDVDVRGWVYTPHKGPPTRKHRLFIGLARQLVGVQAPPGYKAPWETSGDDRPEHPHGLRERLEAAQDKKEAEIVAQEAEAINRKGMEEAEAAGQGQYYERPDRGSDSSTSQSPVIVPDERRASTASTLSWTDPAKMTPDEMQQANHHLMSRLKPFLANPTSSIPISAFFYNSEKSRQKTIDTDAAGHFTVRAALDFVPTHVRILASEKLSATEEIRITEPTGLSVISDIDDTIKHSAISSGAREIFRNVFVREFRELSISGVKEWYKALADRGLPFHYVSNSPWQLFPVLKEFFSKAGLPPGSFHLKQYTGMFQGIFEPVAERKKGTLERIMRDFPERRFLLVGDSGEADLEVYCDVVRENPGRVLGIFIRDVTTKIKKGYFDPAAGPLSAEKFRRSLPASRVPSTRNSPVISARDYSEADIREAVARSLRDQEARSDRHEDRPQLPPRRALYTAEPEEDLIDLHSPTEELAPNLSRSQTVAEDGAKKRPQRPVKPANLSGAPVEARFKDAGTSSASDLDGADLKPPQKSNTAPPMPRRRTSYREKIVNAYNKLSPPSSPRQSPSLGPKNDPRRQVELLSLNRLDLGSPADPLPPKKQMSYPAMAGQALSSVYNTVAGADDSDWSYEPVLDRKEEIWRRRWVQAKVFLEREGVMLRAWRVGDDVCDDSLALVAKAQQDLEQQKGQRPTR